MLKTIKHKYIELKWLTPNDIGKPKTLVLGSFNPFQETQTSVDYFYGRTTNHFWKTIARLIQKDEDYFLMIMKD
jgi:hypothetical protein